MRINNAGIHVVTIEREYGSGAAGIARELATRLDWKLWDQLLTNEVARHLECDNRAVEEQEERKDPLYYRLMRGFLRGSFEGTLNAQGVKIADAEGIRRVSEQLVRAAANEGNAVIVGRGSAYYLRDFPGAFHVFIYAPFEERVSRLQQAGKSMEEAIHLAETVDRDRAAFIKQYFEIDWPARHFFDVMINSTMGESAVVDLILDGMSAIRKPRITGAAAEAPAAPDRVG
jgi:cytidylate kinase